MTYQEFTKICGSHGLTFSYDTFECVMRKLAWIVDVGGPAMLAEEIDELALVFAHFGGDIVADAEITANALRKVI